LGKEATMTVRVTDERILGLIRRVIYDANRYELSGRYRENEQDIGISFIAENGRPVFRLGNVTPTDVETFMGRLGRIVAVHEMDFRAMNGGRGIVHYRRARIGRTLEFTPPVELVEQTRRRDTPIDEK
jgi:hypothetical protein